MIALERVSQDQVTNLVYMTRANEIVSIEKRGIRTGYRANRSRGNSFPLLLIRSTAFRLPPWRASDTFSSRSRTSSSMAVAFALNSGDEVEMSEGSTDV